MTFRPFDNHFARYSPSDGTIDFYTRISSLAGPDKVFLDYGAGRAAWFEDDHNEFRKTIRTMRGKFGEVIAADIDPVVTSNMSSDRTLLIENGKVPVPDHSVDVVMADYVLEHVANPDEFRTEVERILKPGGWFCARTPHKFHYVALIDRVLRDRLGGFVLRYAQPTRKEEDVFAKLYRINSHRQIAAAFPGWKDQSFIYRTDPSYYFDSKLLWPVFAFAHRILPRALVGNMFIFVQKPE